MIIFNIKNKSYRWLVIITLFISSCNTFTFLLQDELIVNKYTINYRIPNEPEKDITYFDISRIRKNDTLPNFWLVYNRSTQQIKELKKYIHLDNDSIQVLTAVTSDNSVRPFFFLDTINLDESKVYNFIPANKNDQKLFEMLDRFLIHQGYVTKNKLVFIKGFIMVVD